VQTPRPFSGRARSVATAARRSAAPSCRVESLEARSMMSVSMGSDGYTDIGRSGDTRTVYVSSSRGNDANSGTSEDSPVKTLKKASSLVRDNMPDHMLLKSGDSWTERLSWGKSGRSSQEPLLIGAYGEGARPMIKAGSGTALDVNAGDVDHLAIVGIHFFAHTRDPNASGFSRTTGSYGIRFVAGTDGLLIEDVVIDQFTNNLLLQGYGGQQSNVKIRRSVITDAYGTEGKAQGMYATKVNGLTLEENVFDHNGWNSQVSGGGASALSHNAYLASDNSNVVVKGNVFSDASSHGLQARAGGVIQDNLFLDNPIHMSFGLVNGSELKPGGVTGTVEGNVMLGTRAIGGSYRGWAVELGNIKNATVRNNIIANDGASGGAAAFSLGFGGNVSNSSSGVGINNLVIENNIVYDWMQAVTLAGNLRPGGSGYTSLNNLTVRNNDFQRVRWQYHHIVSHWMPVNRGEENWSNNRYYEDSSTGEWYGIGGGKTSLDTWRSKVEPTAQSTQVGYSDPNRDVAGSFVDEARKQADGNWRSSYTARSAINYIRDGFNRTGTSTSGGTTTTPPPTTTAPTSGSVSGAPKVVSRSGNSTTVKIKFNENVGASLTAKDLILKHTTKGYQVYDSLRLSYNYSTHEATWTWSGAGSLSAGTWRVTLPDENVKDTSGNTLSGGTDFSFTFNV
jgi:hypothetical protein